MNYFPFHIGDYRAATAHLSNEEDLAYRRLLDMYYDSEQPIPLETQWVSRRLRLDTQHIENVLFDFFTKQDDGWHHVRCDREIAEYVRNAEKNRTNGKKGGRPKAAPVFGNNPVGSQVVNTGMPMETQIKGNQEPVTINHKPITKEDKGEKAQRASRLPPDFKPDFDFAREQGIADPGQEALKFADYWAAQPGTKGTKADWPATWRNWCRNSRDKHPAQGVSIPARSTAANETFAERDARIGRERWEEMTGRTHPDNIKTMPAATQFVEDITPQFLEHTR